MGKVAKKKKKKTAGVPWWRSRLRTWHCHCSGSGHCCALGWIPGPGNSACGGCDPKKKKIEKENCQRRQKVVMGTMMPKGTHSYNCSYYVIICLFKWCAMPSTSWKSIKGHQEKGNTPVREFMQKQHLPTTHSTKIYYGFHVVMQQKQSWLVSVRTWVPSLASLSGLAPPGGWCVGTVSSVLCNLALSI